ncbi:hypothetical protein [Vibrio sp. JC34]
MAQTGVAIWNSLLLPILIAVFVTHLFNVYAEKKEVSVAVWGMVALIVVIHLLVSILQFKGSHMDTMLIEYQDKSTKFQEVKDDFEELK